MLHHAFLGLLVAALTCGLSAQAPEAAEDIRPAKEVVVVPKTFVEILQEEKSTVVLWSSIGGGALLLVIGLLLWRRRHLKLQLNSSARIALLALGELGSDQDGIGAEAFAYLASKILRQYISERFGLAAPRRTTEEFLRDLAKQESSPLVGESDDLRAFLKSCDLAKFAGSHLDSAQRDELIDSARGFIHSTSKAVTP
jgi:hypothetical protein